jgi:hypothetical protein
MKNSYAFLLKKKLSSLVILPAETPFNSPPQIDEPLDVRFVQGTASTVDFNDRTSDPDLDSLTFSLNTGAVSLPTGVTWDAPSGVLSYDGAGGDALSTGHELTIDDGTESIQQTFEIVINNDWPINGAHAQIAVNVSSLEQNVVDEPYRTWNAKKDLMFLQGRYPFTDYVNTIDNAIDTNKAYNVGHKMVLYTNAWRGASLVNGVPNPNTQGQLSLDAHSRNGSPASWLQYDSSRTQVFYGQGPTRFNPWQAIHAAGSEDADFDAAYNEECDRRMGTGGPANILQKLDGWFEDSLDFNDNFGAGGYTSNPNYLDNQVSSGTNETYYRQGVLINHDSRRSSGVWRSDAAQISNGGRDNGAVDSIPTDSDFDWENAFDARLSENASGGSKLGLTSQNNSNEMEVIRNPANALRDFYRSILISELMVDLSGSNRLGKGIVIVDAVFSFPDGPTDERFWVGPLPTVPSDIPDGMWEAARFYAFLCMLHDSAIVSPNINRGSLAFPYLDEFVHDCGAPIGGTPSIGSIDTSSTAFTITLRAFDDNGFWWQEFENGLWVGNCNDPSRDTYPQAATDSVTLPSAGTGFEWRHYDSSYTNPSRSTGATAAENQQPSVNDGSLPDGTGLTLTIPRWHGRYLVRTPT